MTLLLLIIFEKEDKNQDPGSGIFYDIPKNIWVGKQPRKTANHLNSTSKGIVMKTDAEFAAIIEACPFFLVFSFLQ